MQLAFGNQYFREVCFCIRMSSRRKQRCVIGQFILTFNISNIVHWPSFNRWCIAYAYIYIYICHQCICIDIPLHASVQSIILNSSSTIYLIMKNAYNLMFSIVRSYAFVVHLLYMTQTCEDKTLTLSIASVASSHKNRLLL